MFSKWMGSKDGGAWLDSAAWSAGSPTAHEPAVIEGGQFGTISLNPSGQHAASAGRLVINHAHVTLTAGTLTLSPNGQPPDKQVQLSMAHSKVAIDATASIVGTGTVDLLGGVALSIGGHLSDAIAGVLGAGDHVTLDGQGAVWANSESFYAGGTGAPRSLLVENGGTLNVTGVTTFANADVKVNGNQSSINVGTLEIGNGVFGALTISGGAHVTAFEIGIGNAALANVVVTGAGSSLTSTGLGIGVGLIGGSDPASLTVTNGASLTFAGGMSVDGALVLDGTAKVGSQDYISLEGGTIIAEPPPGQAIGPDVVLTNTVFLFGFGSEHATGHVESLPGARLVLAGQVAETAISSERLQIDGGAVVLENATNQISQVLISQGTLEIVATGAAGGHSIDFIGGTGMLQIDAGVSLKEMIKGFDSNSLLIDFAGVAVASASYTYTAVGAGGILTVQDGIHSTMLNLSGYHNAADFFIVGDRHGGTTMYYQGPTHA